MAVSWGILSGASDRGAGGLGGGSAAKPREERIFAVKASLVFVKPDGSQQELPLKKSRLVVGRQEGSNIRLRSASVSRQHCEFIVDDGGVSVKDLGSSNGTFVNKRRVTQTALAAGDLVCVGNHIFVVKMDGQPGAVDAGDVMKRGMVTPAAAAPSSMGMAGGVAVAKPKGAPAAKKPADDLGGDADKDSSSEWDFDFLDEKDKDMPKL
jgi:predicted component of type VI protein secretion system